MAESYSTPNPPMGSWDANAARAEPIEPGRPGLVDAARDLDRAIDRIATQIDCLTGALTVILRPQPPAEASDDIRAMPAVSDAHAHLISLQATADRLARALQDLVQRVDL